MLKGDFREKALEKNCFTDDYVDYHGHPPLKLFSITGRNDVMAFSLNEFFSVLSSTMRLCTFFTSSPFRVPAL